MKIKPVIKEERTSKYWEILNSVEDPEIGYGIVDLGLIYNIKKSKGTIIVYMTLTSPTCPYAPEIISEVEEALENLPEIEDVQVEIVWEPPWGKDKIDEDIKALLFGED